MIVDKLKKTFKKENKKLRIIYDGSEFGSSCIANSSRTGIFFTAMNIFSCMLKSKDVDLVVHTKLEWFTATKRFLRENFSEYNIKVITDKDFSFYSKLKREKDRMKKRKNYIRKALLQLLLVFVAPVGKIADKLYLNYYKNFDVFFSMYSRIPEIFVKSKKMKKYTILYDTIPLLFPDLNPGSNPNSNYMKLIRSLSKDDYYFAISEATRNDFIRLLPDKIDPDKIVTTLLACNSSFKVANDESILKVKEKYSIPSNKKYVFSLCTLEPRKNLIMAVKTFIKFIQKNNIDDMVFVLGGTHWDMFIDKLEKEIENLGEYKDKIVRAGYVPDEDLAPLYSGAEWLVYTSRYEGFGLPPLEAMSCGCPVITSNNSSLPEVVGDAGIMIDYDSEEQHIEAYEKYYYNAELRKEFVSKGLERVNNFSWDKCTDVMLMTMKSNKK